MEEEQLTIYLENVTCTENLEGAVELSSDQLKALVTFQSPVNCKYIMSVCAQNSRLLFTLCSLCFLELMTFGLVHVACNNYISLLCGFVPYFV